MLSLDRCSDGAHFSGRYIWFHSIPRLQLLLKNFVLIWSHEIWLNCIMVDSGLTTFFLEYSFLQFWSQMIMICFVHSIKMLRLLTDSILSDLNRFPVAQAMRTLQKDCLGTQLFCFEHQRIRPFTVSHICCARSLGQFFIKHSVERTDFCPKMPQVWVKSWWRDRRRFQGGLGVWPSFYHGLFYRHSGVETIAFHDVCIFMLDTGPGDQTQHFGLI